MNDAPKTPPACDGFPEDAPWPKLGSCCGCGKTHRTVRNVYSLGFEAPIPGTGWGCVVCGLPENGAVAVICDACHDAKKPILAVCVGYAGKDKRMSYDLAGTAAPFGHDVTKHPGEVA